MGMWSEREAAVVTFNLKRWFFTTETSVTGVIYNSTNNKEYLDDTEMAFLNISVKHYPKSEEYGDGHFLCRTETGTVFRLNGSDHI